MEINSHYSTVETNNINQALQLIQANRPCEAFLILKKLADEDNNPDAQNLLGDMYFCGIGVNAQDLVEATNYYTQAAQNGNASSSNNLGYAFQYGLNVDQKMAPKPHEAMTHYIQALITTGCANQENTDFVEGILQNLKAQQEFAVNIYDSGEHMTPHSYFLQVAGSYEYSRSPDLLSAFAIIKNACLLKGGKPGSADLSALNELQEKILVSAQQDLKKHNYLEAYKKLFFLAKDTHVTEKNQATALRLLGKMYCQGLGVAQDIRQAIKCLNVPAKQGDDKACLLLGEIYSADTRHFDYELAMEWYQRAGKEGVEKVTQLKSKIYDSALKDLDNLDINWAIEKLTFLAKAGDAKAQYKLGEINLNWGLQTLLATKQDYYFSLAFHYFNDAISNHYLPAYFMAGQALEHMDHVLSDQEVHHQQKVLSFYERASVSDDPQVNHHGCASFAIATILGLNDENNDKLKLPGYLERAHQQGYPKALAMMFILSEKYLKQYEEADWSDQNKIDLITGTELFKLALKYGCPQAVEKQKAQEKAISDQVDRKLQEKLQREKELEETFSMISKSAIDAMHTISNWFTPDPDKSIKNPFHTPTNPQSYIEDSNL